MVAGNFSTKSPKCIKIPILHAAIIYQFQEKAEWSASELSAALIPVSTLQRKIVFWQTQGLIKESGLDNYVLVEEGLIAGSLFNCLYDLCVWSLSMCVDGQYKDGT